MNRMFGVIVGAACAVFSMTALAQGQAQGQRADLGKREFEANCASCHGASGKGNGPITDLLKKSPPDLTLLAKNNGGALPVSRLYEVIDGTGVSAHGTREMPVWGHDYRVQAAEHYIDVPYEPESYVRARILALIDYINRMQVK